MITILDGSLTISRTYSDGSVIRSRTNSLPSLSSTRKHVTGSSAGASSASPVYAAAQTVPLGGPSLVGVELCEATFPHGTSVSFLIGAPTATRAACS